MTDEPLGYQPSVGPRVSLYLNYKQRESVAGTNGTISNMGTNWHISWVSYVQDMGYDLGRGYRIQVLLGKAGLRTMVADGTTLDYYTGLKMKRLTGANQNTIGFHLLYPSGAIDVYKLPSARPIGGWPTYFLTAKIDAAGNQLTFQYDINPDLYSAHLLAVVDADHRVTRLNYEDPRFPSRITSVTDPFNRTAYFAYDPKGLLTNITDVAGFSSSFSYDAHAWMTRMVTPYGTNSFKITGTDSPNVLNGRAIEITEPDGNKQLYVYRDGLTNVYSEAYPAREVPSTANANFSFGNSFDNSAMYDRNSFYWGRLQYELLSTNYLHSGDIYQLTAADYLVSRLRHWLKHQDGSQRAGRTLSLERLPSPNAITEGQKTWYDYDWKSSTDTEGTEIMPSLIARVLPDGTTQFRRYLRNNWGLVTEENSTYSKEDGTIDVRTTTYQYATNDIDTIAVTNPLGIRVSSNYFNAHHQLLTNYNALDEMTVWHYNERQQVVGIEYPGGLVTTNYYDNRGQLALTIDFAILGTNTIYYRTNSYRYANNLIYTHTDERGLTTTNYWDKLQRLTAEIDSRGTNRYFYDKLDLVKTVDRLGHTTSFGYNSVRQKIAETNALGTVTGYSYCLCGSPDSVTNAVGTALEQTTQSNHDYEGRPTFVLYPDNSSFTYYYDPLGRVTNVLDAARHGVTNYFNNQGFLVVTSNYYGRSTAVTYDVLDRPRSVVDANGVTVINTYDKLGRLLSRSRPDAGEENFGYLPNVAGLSSYKNQLGVHVVQYAYDPLGRKVQDVFPGIATNSYAYDGAGSLTSLTDGKGQTTRWTYDPYGRVSTKSDTTGANLFTYTYYPTDQVSTRIDALNKSTIYEYDPAGNLTRVVYPSRTNSYAYDALGRLTNMVDSVGNARYTCKYSYTSGGFLESEDGPWPDDTVTYRWKNGLPIGLSLLQPNAWPWTQGYGYDAAERLARVSSPAGTFSYSYQGGGNLVTNLALPNGAAIVNAFDGVGRLTGTWLRNGAGTILNSHTYNVDPAHHRIRQARWDGSYVNYAYDNLGALKAAFGYERNGAARLHEQFGYAYDAAGNLNYRTNNGLVQRFEVNNLNELADVTRRGTLTVAGTTGSAATEVTVNGIPANRYNDWTFALAGFPLADGDNVYTVIAQDRYGRKDRNSITVNLPAMVRFTYDRNGNLIRDGSRNFDYDDENQLICVTVPNSWKSEFIYDGRMRRRIRKEFIWSANAWMPTREVRYFYDGDLVIQERDGGNAPTVSYTRGRDLSGGLQGAGGIGGLLARSDVSGPVPSHAYYHADGNGNITALINAQQFVVARYLYDPFGNTLAKAGPLCDVNLYRFSSKEVHLASGLVYYLYRFYDPNLQRWLNRDPIQEQGGINLYAFAGNQPVGRVDETGMRVIDWDDYFNQWIHAHPGLTAEQHDWVEWQLARGCVGLTCVNLGWTKNDWPDTSNCYKTRKQAMRRAREMKKDCSCGNSSSPQIFSIHFWNNTGSDNLSPDMKVNPATGKVGLSNWDHEPRNFHQVNYDYGYLLPNGKILHANHYHNPDRNGDGIGDYFPSSSISKAKVKVNRRFLWTLVGHFGPAYNSEVWCVACDGGGYVSK